MSTVLEANSCFIAFDFDFHECYFQRSNTAPPYRKYSHVRSSGDPPHKNYSHVRSSGYLTPKYRYRRLPTSMSWLDEDTDLNDIDWSRGPQSPEPQLDDFIQKVLQNKRVPITRKKENAYKSALYLAANIVEAAFELEWLYQTYIRNTERKPVISDFRAVDKNIYVGLVPLRKPVRLDSFKVKYTVFFYIFMYRIICIGAFTQSKYSIKFASN